MLAMIGGMRSLVFFTAACALGLALVPATIAKDGDVLVLGICTNVSTSKLKLSPDDGALEVEFEVDQNRNGVRWTVSLRRVLPGGTLLLSSGTRSPAPRADPSSGESSPIVPGATGSVPGQRAFGRGLPRDRSHLTLAFDAGI